MQVSKTRSTAGSRSGHGGADVCEVQNVGAERVDRAVAALISVDEASELSELFRLLGDPTRVRILYALLEAGELCVCDIAAVVDTSEPVA